MTHPEVKDMEAVFSPCLPGVRWTARFGWIAALGAALATAGAAAPVATPLGSYSDLLQSPARLATDAAGNVYVTEPQSGKVILFDAYGRLAEVKEGFDGPLAIAINESGNIHLAEEKNGSVTVFDPDWNPLHQLGSGRGEFALPNHIAFDSTPGSNTIYVADSSAHEIKAYRAGTLAFKFGSLGTNSGQFNFPTGIAVSEGEVFVVDQENSRIQAFDRDGGFLREFSSVTTRGSSLGGSAGGRSLGITRDAEGRLYVADTLQGLINVFDSQGAALLKISSYGVTPGKLRSPASLTIDPCNRLLITSVNNNRLELIGLDSFLHLTAIPAHKIVSAGTDVTFSAATGGTGPFTYQWRKDDLNLSDSGNVSGTASATLSLTGVTPDNAGNYSVVLGSPSGSLTSPAAPLTVLMPPSVVGNPVSQIVAQGGSVSFSVVAEGDSPVYQWQFDGANIAGATASTLLLTNGQLSDAGTYTVVVSNPVGAVTSAAATLTVLIPPTVAIPPNSLTVIQGTDLNFQVTAAGDSLAYQWQFQSAPIPNATADVLQLTNVQPELSGSYSVVVSNLVGGVVSEPASLLVIIPPIPPTVEVDIQPDGRIHLSLVGLPGYAYFVQASADLITWTNVTRFPDGTSTITLAPPEPLDGLHLFFRLRWSL